MASAPLTSQQRQAILNGASIFEEGVNAMKSVYSEVFASSTQLKGQAMVSTAGLQFSSAITQWTDDFNNITSLLQAMHDQLLDTTNTTTSTNQSNTEIATALSYTPPNFS
jgi:inhibitor of KinA sporulation pathway (predicted exonuclease)